jgi:hypothetical protein
VVSITLTLKIRRITVEDTNRWHDQQHSRLLEEIQKARENDEHVFVIITHHVPSRHDTYSKKKLKKLVLKMHLSMIMMQRLTDLNCNRLNFILFSHTYK